MQESTGEKGRIQVSEFTANLLRNAGREYWLIEREDLVEAKGKGEDLEPGCFDCTGESMCF